jgi:hypothetical protein
MIDHIIIILIVIFILVSISILIYAYFKTSQKMKKSKLEIERDGFLDLFFGAGYNFIAFNDKRETRVGNLLRHRFRDYPVSCISRFEWKWAIEKTGKLEHEFVFYINDVDYPIHKIFYSDKKNQAEYEWAKIQAIYMNQSGSLDPVINPQYIINSPKTQIFEKVDQYNENNDPTI